MLSAKLNQYRNTLNEMPFWIIMLFVVAALGFFTEAPVNLFGKAVMYSKCLLHMVATSDTKKTKDPRPVVKQQETRGRKVRVIFIRHGESVWNSVVNKFGLGWPVRVIRSFLNELVLWFTNAKDSVFIDSPLSADGINQAQALASFLSRNAELITSNNSALVTSNLRRAMETASIGCALRSSTVPNDRIVIDSLLQEGTRNVDGASFTEAKKLPPGPLYGLESSAAAIAKVFDGSTHNDGNKPLASSVHVRIDNFALRLFGECPEGQASHATPDGGTPSTIVVVGHSLWFKNFFNRFLPSTSTHVSKSKKIQNCGIVSFDLVADATSGELTIDETSIREPYLGFTK